MRTASLPSRRDMSRRRVVCDGSSRILDSSRLCSHSLSCRSRAVLAGGPAGSGLLLRELVRLLLVLGVALVQVQRILGRVQQVSALQILHKESIMIVRLAR